MDPGAAAREAAQVGDFGAVIRLSRQARGLTLQQLGELSAYSHSALSRLERRGGSGTYNLATLRHLADVLDIPPHLVGLTGAATRPPPTGAPVLFSVGEVFTSSLPSIVEARPARRRAGAVMVDVDGIDAAPRRGIVVGETDDGVRVALDAREAWRRTTRAAPGAPLLVPAAYVLDDLTAGVAWAVANLDEPLLCDDARLDAWHRRLTTSTFERDTATNLHPVSRMWLGSEFCARHILANMAQLTETPLFWTQERRGEQASGWLLFAHKFEYLRRTAARTVRAFCVPPDAVAATPGSERVLFLLAAALIESFGIEVAIAAEPGYSAVEGCVLDGSRQAIVAAWVGIDALWHVDITQARPTVREFADAIGYARAHSVISASTPAARLAALADYLSVNWRWVTARCAEFGDYGAAGLSEPSSRLLSTVGVDRAARFLGDLSRT